MWKAFSRNFRITDPTHSSTGSSWSTSAAYTRVTASPSAGLPETPQVTSFPGTSIPTSSRRSLCASGGTSGCPRTLGARGRTTFWRPTTARASDATRPSRRARDAGRGPSFRTPRRGPATPSTRTSSASTTGTPTSSTTRSFSTASKLSPTSVSRDGSAARGFAGGGSRRSTGPTNRPGRVEFSGGPGTRSTRPGLTSSTPTCSRSGPPGTGSGTRPSRTRASPSRTSTGSSPGATTGRLRVQVLPPPPRVLQLPVGLQRLAKFPGHWPVEPLTEGPVLVVAVLLQTVSISVLLLQPVEPRVHRRGVLPTPVVVQRVVPGLLLIPVVRPPLVDVPGVTATGAARGVP